MAKIVTVTLNPAIDESSSVERVVPEDKLRCAAPTFEAGGGGLNVSRVLTRLGADNVALWTQAGPAGDQLAQLIEATQIRHQPVEVSGLTRTNLVVYESSTTRQYRFGMPGPTLSDSDRAAVIAAIVNLEPKPEILVLSGSLPPGAPEDLYAHIIRDVPGSTRIILDTSGAALRAALGAGVELVKPNLGELARLEGRELEDDDAIAEAASRLVASGGARQVVVSLGAGGAIAVSTDGVFHARAPTVPIRSKVGAGDSMVGGLVYEIERGQSLDVVLRRGVAAGAAAVMTAGSELCRSEDVARLFALTHLTRL